MRKSELDKLIICPHCQSVHKKINLNGKSVAKCSECGEILYRNSKLVFERTFALSISALFLFIVANAFPIIKIYVLSQHSELTIPDMILRLFDEGFIVLGSIIFLVLLAIPSLVLVSFVLIGILTYLKLFKSIVKILIIFVVQAKEWAMVDIFFVSILVALVKLFGYVQVRFDIAFVALMLFVILDIFTLKSIKPVELWQYYQRVYNEE